MKLSVRRVYEPAKATDGTRVLVDRLWPRGISKAKAKVDVWAKDLGPTNELRKWFHVDPEKRYKQFAAKYKKELTPKKKAAKDLFKGLRSVTLVTAVRDLDHSHIPTLTAFLKRV